MRVPFTALETSKGNSTPLYTRESISLGSADTSEAILRHKSERDSTLSLCMMSLVYPKKKKPLDVKSGLCGGQLIGPPLPILPLGNRWSRAVRTVAPKCEAESGLFIFQQDGVLAHCGAIVSTALDEQFSSRWIGRGWPINCPSKSPDLTPTDFVF
jgi:hypothetical protein